MNDFQTLHSELNISKLLKKTFFNFIDNDSILISLLLVKLK